MSKKAFDEFINRQTQKKSDDRPINWEKRKDNWLVCLSQFYEKIEFFLEDYLKEDKLTINYSKKDVFERYIGGYSVNVLNIEFGDHKLKLDPVGTNIIGAKGRVDLIGANGTVKFVWVDKDLTSPKVKVDIRIEGEKTPEKIDTYEETEWDWRIATSPPVIKYINFEQDAFFEALMEVIGG